MSCLFHIIPKSIIYPFKNNKHGKYINLPQFFLFKFLFLHCSFLVHNSWFLNDIITKFPFHTAVYFSCCSGLSPTVTNLFCSANEINLWNWTHTAAISDLMRFGCFQSNELLNYYYYYYICVYSCLLIAVNTTLVGTHWSIRRVWANITGLR